MMNAGCGRRCADGLGAVRMIAGYRMSFSVAEITHAVHATRFEVW
jgi:hypothetical protein